VVRQNTTPAPLRLWVVLNADRRGEPELAPGGAAEAARLSGDALDERSIALAAALLRNAADNDMAVGLAVPMARLLHPPRMGKFHLDRLLTELALLELGALRAAGPIGFPDPVARSGACVVVHTGEIDRSFGPRHAAHLRAGDLDRLVEAGAHTATLLELIDATLSPRPRRRLWPIRIRAREAAA
jgi:hypothetical protein